MTIYTIIEKKEVGVFDDEKMAIETKNKLESNNPQREYLLEQGN